MSARSSSPTPQTFFRRRKIALGHKVEARDQSLHRRVEAIAFLELYRQAFGEIARADSGRIETLQNAEHGLDFADAGAELFRNRFKIAADISGLVDEIDEILADHALRRIGDGERELLAQPVRERDFRRHEGLEVVLAVLAAARADPRPFRIAGRVFGGARRADLGIVGEYVFAAGVERVFGRAWLRLRRLGIPRLAVGGRPLRPVEAVAFGWPPLLLRAAIKQRIALEFRLDIGHQIQVRQLQQLDRLHQLRRHHQGLALADLQSLGQRHGREGLNWSDSCF